MTANQQAWRRGLLAKVHIGKKALGMADGDYRAVLDARYGVGSAGDLTLRQLDDLVSYFEKQGVEYPEPGQRAKRPGKRFYEVPDGVHFDRQKRLIAAMWCALGWNMSGLDARCARQFKVAKFLWLKDQGQLQTLAKDLHNRCRRKGLDPECL